MKVFETTGEVAVPAATVWRRAADPTAWPDWNDSVRSARLVDDGPLHVGQRVRLHQRRLPPTTWTVTEVDDGRSFAWTSSAPGTRTTGDHVVEATGPSSCRVTLRLTFTGPLAALTAAAYGRLIRRYLALELAGLGRP